jgi:hypothetical protein
MPMRVRSRRGPIPPVLAIAFLFLAHLCYAQSDSLALSSGTAGANGIASLNLVLTSPAGSEPASIQFTLTFPAANVTSISVSPGPTAIGAGKTAQCALASGAYTCLLFGLNATTISNGIVAVVNLTIAANVTIGIGIGNPVAASPTGEAILLSATGATVTPTVTSQVALSVSPSSGSGASQMFTFVYTDVNGAADLASAQVIINSSLSEFSGCYVYAFLASGTVALANDAVTSWAPATTLGTSATQQNSQCALNVAASSGTRSGNTYTLNLAIGFQAGFAGAKSVYSYAGTALGFNSGWQQLGTWTVPSGATQLPTESVSPSSGSGASQMFTFVYTDVNGAADLASAQVVINSSLSEFSACYVYAFPARGTVALANDNVTSWAPATTLGTGGTQQNSQCALNVAASSGTLSGNTYTLNLAIGFQAGFAGAKSVYSYASTALGFNSGWQTLGAWTVPSGATQLPTVSASPLSGSGASQTFAFVFSDVNGASDLTSTQVIFNSSLSGVSSCYLYTVPGSGAVYLANNANNGWSGPMNLGVAGTLQNSQCAINMGTSSGVTSGNTYTMSLAVTFQAGFAGTKGVFGYVLQNTGGLTSGWQTLGTWTVPSGAQPPTESVSPLSGSGVSQPFTFIFTDVNGASDLASTQVLFNAGLSAVSACYVYTHPGSGAVYLANDADNGWSGPLTLGGAGTLQNSQCAINMGASSGLMSGNTYTISLAITFQAGFTGAKSVFGYVLQTTGGLTSGWQTLGSWNLPGGATQLPPTVSVSPLSGSGVSQTFAFVFSDVNGASNLNSTQVIFDASLSPVSSCYLYTLPGSGAVYLANNANNGWSGPLTLGVAGTLQNSQCAINMGASSGVTSGNTYTMNLAVTFQAGFTGAKSVYGYVLQTTGGLNSGWQTLGAWNVPGTVQP